MFAKAAAGSLYKLKGDTDASILDGVKIVQKK
jgi:hypothetical protein